MAIMDSNADQELMRLWSLIQDLGEQLAQNRNMAVTLHSQLGSVKTQAIHSQSGFVLRRFNLDKSKEDYEAELDRMNNVMGADNQALQYDNKQLNALIKEYEQTLETVMSTFRTRANEVQEHELALIREYEAQLIMRETEDLERELAARTAFSESLSRISELLRLVTRSMNGENASHMPADYESTAIVAGGTGPSDEPMSVEQVVADWALDRECELARLEKENEELRRLSGQIPDTSTPFRDRHETQESDSPNFLSSFPRLQQRLLGGAPGMVGPFGTYKRRGAG